MARLKQAIQSLYISSIGIVLTISFAGCSGPDKPMPIFGERSFNGTDTIYHTIAPFAFYNQDSMLIQNDDVTGKVYVADFFFTSCRTICPKMKTQMKRVYEATEGFEDFLILSHTIDPEYDNVKRLKVFAEKLEVDGKRWHFLTGDRDSIFNLAQTSYFATAMEDKNEPDGYIHSGAFLLIDRKGRIRGKYDGTLKEDTDRLIADIKRLRLEQ